jgi:hypothetical protein
LAIFHSSTYKAENKASGRESLRRKEEAVNQKSLLTCSVDKELDFVQFLPSQHMNYGNVRHEVHLLQSMTYSNIKELISVRSTGQQFWHVPQKLISPKASVTSELSRVNYHCVGEESQVELISEDTPTRFQTNNVTILNNGTDGILGIPQRVDSARIRARDIRVKCPLLLFDFNQNWNVCTNFSKPRQNKI